MNFAPKTVEGEERPYLYFDDVLDAFFLSARSVTYTLNPGSYCHRCSTAFHSDRPFIRQTILAAAGFELRLKTDNRSRSDLGPIISDIVGPGSPSSSRETHEPCKGPLTRVDIVIDRLPPFLLLVHAWEECNHERLCADITVQAYHREGQPSTVKLRRVAYSWVGLVVQVRAILCTLWKKVAFGEA